MLLVKRSCVSSCAPLRLFRDVGTDSAWRGMSCKCKEGMQVKDSGSSGVSCKTDKTLSRSAPCIIDFKLNSKGLHRAQDIKNDACVKVVMQL